MSHAVQMEALARENEQLRRQVASSGGSVEQEPRRWGSAANRVMDWFRGGGSSSAVVPTGTQTLLNSLQNLIPKASRRGRDKALYIYICGYIYIHTLTEAHVDIN